MNRIQTIISMLTKKTAVTDPIKICNLLDIEILRIDLGKHIGGFKISTIYVNLNLSESIQTFIIAHELGHILLHKGIKTPFFKYTKSNSFIPKIEAEANIFAILLLLSNFYNQQDFLDVSPDQIIKQIGLPKHLTYLFHDSFDSICCYKK